MVTCTIATDSQLVCWPGTEILVGRPANDTQAALQTQIHKFMIHSQTNCTSKKQINRWHNRRNTIKYLISNIMMSSYKSNHLPFTIYHIKSYSFIFISHQISTSHHINYAQTCMSSNFWCVCMWLYVCGNGMHVTGSSTINLQYIYICKIRQSSRVKTHQTHTHIPHQTTDRHKQTYAITQM